MKSFAIIGLGLFGTQLAKDLYAAGCNVLAIDKNEDLIEEISDYVTDAVSLDAKKRDSLSHIGIDNYDCAVVAISSDLATSVLITMNLKALHVPEIICKVQSEADQEALETLGATSCIVPEHVAATKMSKRLTSRHIIDFTQVSDDYSILEFLTPESWTGKSIADLKLRSKHAINVIGIRRNNVIHVDFDPYAALDYEDELIVIGKNSSLDEIQRLR